MNPSPRDTEPRAFQPPRTNRGALLAAVVAVAVLLAAAGYMFWQQRAPAPAAPSPAVVAEAPAATPAPAPSQPAIRHPIDAVDDAASMPAAPGGADPLLTALLDLLGQRTVTAMVLTDDFARRVVATVDNLGRPHAPSRLWPVVPAPGRFTVERVGGGEQIAAINTRRYDALVKLVTAVDAERAAATYKRIYPRLQRAYEELGYPNGYFNDRLVEVIDLLLATPEPQEPLAVRLTEVKGPIESERPWVRYEFADPALRALPAGPKMLLRVGNHNAQRLKAQLRALRAHIAHSN
jgi:hypothetical protein